MNNAEYRKLNKLKLLDRKRTTISTQESLDGIIPIDFKKKIHVDFEKK